jgi:hypothetical protein
MFVGHFAIALAAKRLEPAVSLGTWFLAVQFVDLIWPFFLLAGLEHVRIAPGITAFTPLDFYDYPITHSLLGGAVWAGLIAVFSRGFYRDPRALALIAAGVLSHWALDAIVHRPDLPLLPSGPYIGLGLWNSVAATLALELAMFAGGIYLYTRTVRPRASFWVLIAALLVAYVGAAFGPPPPDVRTLAWSAIAVWIFIPWAWWADKARLQAEG